MVSLAGLASFGLGELQARREQDAQEDLLKLELQKEKLRNKTARIESKQAGFTSASRSRTLILVGTVAVVGLAAVMMLRRK